MAALDDQYMQMWDEVLAITNTITKHMKTVFRGLRDTYTRITNDTPLVIFTDKDLPVAMLGYAVIAACLSISTGIVYLGSQAMGTYPLLYPLALIFDVLYTLGGMALLIVLLVGGLLLSLCGMYWMAIVPLTVGVWLWSLVPSKYVRRK